VPGIAVFVLIAFLQTCLVYGLIPFTEQTSLSLFIQEVIGAPLRALAGGYVGSFIYLTLIDIFWFFGIHGPNTLAFMDQGIFSPAAVQNGLLISSGVIDAWQVLDPAALETLGVTAQPSIYNKSMMDAFVFLGGSGATLGLIIAILIVSKKEADRKIAKYGLTPALFNINEPIIFGLPIVFNPILFIPFCIIHPILLTSAVTVIELGLIPQYAITIPWTSPIGIGAFLGYGGSIAAFVFAGFQLVIATVIYYPFVVLMNKAQKKQADLQVAK
jgi:PTS system cellobiose-specific IIC component